MFASHAHVFEDELVPQRQQVPGKPVAGKSGKGLSARNTKASAYIPAKNSKSDPQSNKPKRRALANITNANTKASGNTSSDKGTAKDHAIKPANTVFHQPGSSASISKTSLPSPEKLVGPTGRDMEEAAAAAEHQRIEEKVAFLLHALEGAWKDDISDLSRDTISETDALRDLDYSGPVCTDELGPLPDCPFPPLFMDFIDS